MSRVLTFVTGNAGKLSEVRAVLGSFIEVRNADIDLDEFQGEMEEISRRKCEAATEKVEGLVMVEDTSLCFNALGGLPGPYIKWFLKELGPAGLHRMLAGFEDKSATAVCTLSFSYGKGQPVHVVSGRCEGTIVSPRGPNTFGWDPCFEPLNTGKTFAEMTKEEKNTLSHRSKALAALQEALRAHEGNYEVVEKKSMVLLSRLLPFLYRMPPPPPRVVFIFGCTGTGKSDLGVEIALKYGGEVVNADSLQVYDALSIATNKITVEEARGIPHHLLGFVSPLQRNFNVQQFQKEALSVISSIHSRGKLAVVVGGTSYYMENLIYESLLVDTPKSEEDLEEPEDLKCLSNEELHAILRKEDDESADSIHPNNRRRVWRALHICRTTGRKRSSIFEEQREESEGSRGRLRYKESLLLYLDAPKEILNARLDKRVVKMREGGLRKEMEDFWKKYGRELKGERYGIMQGIGLKEFVPFLEEEDPAKREQLFEKGIEEVQLHTRQYSRKQRSWVNNRFVREKGRELPSFVQLDSSSPSLLFERGLEVVGRFINGEKFEFCVEQEKEEDAAEANRVYRCEECDRTITGTKSLQAHLR